MPGVQTCALRSEEHTSELQSHDNLVCRLLLEQKKSTSRGTPTHAHGARTRRRVCGGRRAVGDLSCCGAGVFGEGGRLGHCRPLFFFFNDPATPEISPLSLPDPLPINDTATTEIYTLSLHDALPISVVAVS